MTTTRQHYTAQIAEYVDKYKNIRTCLKNELISTINSAVRHDESFSQMQSQLNVSMHSNMKNIVANKLFLILPHIT